MSQTSNVAARPTTVSDILGPYWQGKKSSVVEEVPPTTFQERRDACAVAADTTMVGVSHFGAASAYRGITA